LSFWLERACKHKGVFGNLQRNKSPLENEGPFPRRAGFGAHESASFATDTIAVHPVAMERLVDPSRPGLLWGISGGAGKCRKLLDNVQGEMMAESGSQASVLVSYMGGGTVGHSGRVGVSG